MEFFTMQKRVAAQHCFLIVPFIVLWKSANDTLVCESSFESQRAVLSSFVVYNILLGDEYF